MRIVCRLLLIFFALGTVSWAQVDRGTISGIVSDASGAALPAVAVTLVQTETGVHYQGDVTNGQGVYRILNLPVGHYGLTFSKDGFKAYVRTGVSVSMSQNVTLNPKMEVGSRVDTVTVTADASLLDTEDALLGSTVSGDVLRDLPLTADGGRDARNFARSVVATFSTVSLQAPAYAGRVHLTCSTNSPNAIDDFGFCYDLFHR